MLTEGQQGDVAFAEARFAKENGFGVMFTNGTGTGKTYTGLGIVKRAQRQGKKNILIIAPSDKVIADWTARGENLLLDIKALPDTASNNGGGLAITTYANLATNLSLAGVEWDMVLADEAHHLLANKDGEETAALSAFRAITKHPQGRWHRARMILREEDAAREEANRRLRQVERDHRTGSATTAQLENAKEAVRQANEAFEEKARPIYEDVMRAGQARPRAVFLSATPFAYVPNVDYAEGYLFSFDDWGRAPQPETGYNKPGYRDAFYIQHFGYKMRYGRLEQPDPEVDRGLMERNFNGWLKREGVLSGRMLEVDQDYDRRFVMSDHPLGQKIDEGLEWLREHDDLKPLYYMAIGHFGYLERRFLLEAIKARDVVPMVKAHLALGRKVVIVHDYKVGGAGNPFHFEKTGKTTLVYNPASGQHELVELDPLIDRFNAERPDLANLAVSRMPPALTTLKGAFPDALVFNGDVPKRERRKAVEEFQKDGNGKNVIIVQSSAGREGVSLHDETGRHPRVLFNLGLPVQPTAAIQLEGRIFRLGQMSNAAFRYLNTGTSWERWAFAGTIAQRAGTAENLALGDDARALRQAFIDAFEDAEAHAASDADGTGGKERDRASAATMTPFERAKTFYFAQQRRTSRNKSREGLDYFATPEPLALKMVEWGDIQPGDSLLEPSAGHGAIARFFPEMHRAKMVEPSMELGSRAKLAAPHVEAVSGRFEDLDIHNKADVIVMNPPFGTGGKTAMEHVAKAFGHLRDGGRIVAIIPEGPSMEKRFDAWLYGEDAKGRSTNPYAFLVASIKLPRSTFERAGTEVAARVVIIEKHYDTEKAKGIQQVNRDYSGASTIREFFDRIEDATVPARVNPQPEDGADFAPPPGVAQNTPRYARSPYQRDIFGNDLPLATGGGAPLFQPEEAAQGAGDVDAAAALPPAWFSQEVRPVTTGRVSIGVERVRSADDAAHVFAALRKDYRERFAVLVLDGGDRPIAYLPLFAGERAQTAVYPAIIAAEVYTTPGARKLWIAHNHPSGNPEPSFQDQALTRNIASIFGADLGVELAGHVVIAGGDFRGLDAEGMADGPARKIPAKGRLRSVPIVERRVVVTDRAPRESIGSPSVAKDTIPRVLNGHTGVVYLDAQNRIMAAVPGRLEDMRELRRDNRLRRALAPAARAGASGAIYYLSLEDAKARGEAGAAADLRNLAAAAYRVLEVKALDLLIQREPWPKRPDSMAETGMEVAGDTFFARGERSPVVSSLEAIASAPNAFRYPESTATAWADVIRDMAGSRGWRAAPGDGLGDELATGASRLYLYRGGDKTEDGLLLGSTAFLEINQADTLTPYATIGGKLDTEGALAYQIAMTWAHNNGKRLVPDPSGLTAKNRLRRSEAMLSSMLRHKTSVHLEPHASQYVGLLDEADFEGAREFMSRVEPGTAVGRKLERLKAALWKDEALAETPEEAARIYEANLHNLALASSLLTHRLYPDAYLLEVRPDGEVRDTITDEPVPVDVEPEISARFGVGRSTLARAVAVRSALQGVDTFDVAALRLDRDGFLQPGGAAILAAGGDGRGLSAAGASRMVAEQGPVLYRRGAQDEDAVPIADIAAGTAKPLRREGLSASGVYRLLYAGLGQDGVDALVDAGVLRVVSRIADLPANLRRVIEESGNPVVDAVYDGERTAYIVASNIDPDRVVPVVFHEIGEHFGLERLLGPEDYAKVLDKVRALHANGDRVVTEAWRHVLVHYRNDRGELELPEGSDDFVKEVIARVGEGAPAMSQSWWRELLQMVRNALRRMGFTVELTADDLVTLVRASLANVVHDARQARYVPSSADERVRSVAFHLAYHGSPYDFDAFSTAHVGSGEGAQAYGWGLYFAGKRAVAEFYRSKLARVLEVKIDGVSLHKLEAEANRDEFDNALPSSRDVNRFGYGRIIDATRYPMNPADTPLAQVRSAAERVANEARVNHAERGANDRGYIERERGIEKLALDVVKAVDEGRVTAHKGRLYEVDLAPKEEDYLDWDRPLNEQSDIVKQRLEAAGLLQKSEPPRWTRQADGGQEFRDRGGHLLGRFIPNKPGRPEEGYDVYHLGGPGGMKYRGWAATQEAARATIEAHVSDIWKGGPEWARGGEFYRDLGVKLNTAQEPDGGGPRGWGGFVQTINDRPSNDKAASLYLKSIGIPGIRYLDGSSRGFAGRGVSYRVEQIGDKWAAVKTGQSVGPQHTYFDTEAEARAWVEAQQGGHHNYVIFDEADVTVRAKFSRAMSPAALAADLINQHGWKTVEEAREYLADDRSHGDEMLMEAANELYRGEEHGQSRAVHGYVKAALERAEEMRAELDGDGPQVSRAQRQPDIRFSRPTREQGIPPDAAKVIASLDTHFALRNVAGYLAAKTRGDNDAAQRAVRAIVRREDLAEAKRRFGADVTYLAAAAAERGGDNVLPFALAAYYAAATGAQVDGSSVVQVNRAYHTGADKLERLVSRPLFDGPVEQGRRYVLVDDVVTRGGTIAELADHVRAEGGEVVGVVALAKSTPGATLEPLPAHVRAIERNEILRDVTRNVFQIEPRALTRDEAEFIASLGGQAAEFRDRAIAAAGRRRDQLRGGGVPPGSPAPGVSFSRPRPSGNPVLDEARRKAGLVRDTRNLAERVRDYLGRGWSVIRQDLADFRHALAQGAVDRFHAIKRLEETLGGVPAEQSAYVAARLSTGTSSVMRGMLLYGAPELREGIIQRKDGSKGLLDVLAPVKADFDDWIGWMVGVRATRLMKEKREHNLTEQEIEALVRLGEGKTDRFIAVAREFAAYKRAVLDLAEAAGLVNPETRPVWDQADWIPFYRVKDGAAAGPKGRRGLAGQTSGIRTLKGGEQALNDPLENILLNFTHLVDASMKNIAMQRAVEIAGDSGILEHAPHEWEREIVAASDIKKRLQEHGVAEDIIDFMPQDVFKGLAAMWAIKPPRDKDVVRVMFGGKPAYYRVLDPLLLRALTSVDAPDLRWTEPMRAFKRILTRGVTATPDFMARNFLRDALSAWAINDDHFRVGIDSVRGAVKSLREEGGMLDMMFAGGSFMGGYVNGNDPTATAEATRKALRERGWNAASVDEFMATIIDTPVRWWEKWEEIGAAIENANREAVYEAATREGKTKARAVFEAKDLMDYSMRGDWTLFQVLGDVVPFFNARLQGLYKLGRAAADHPGRMAFRGGIIMLATLALLAANDGDDRYEELEEWDRDTYWHFWIGGQHLRIPKPFEIGVIFATIPERMARMIAGREAPDLTMKRLWWNLSESLNLVQWPQIVAPAAEVWANRSTFTGRPIESRADEAKLPEARYTATTSDTMKAIARLAPDAVNATGMSPKRMEHLWRGYLGELGAYALGLSDIAVRAVTGAPPRPALRADDVPLVKSFVREDPPRATKWRTELYDMDREVEQIYRSVMAYRRDGDTARARDLIEKEGAKLAARPALTAATDRLADIRRERERITLDPTMTREDKRLRLDELQAIENELSERAARTIRPAFTQ